MLIFQRVFLIAAVVLSQYCLSIDPRVKGKQHQLQRREFWMNLLYSVCLKIQSLELNAWNIHFSMSYFQETLKLSFIFVSVINFNFLTIVSGTTTFIIWPRHRRGKCLQHCDNTDCCGKKNGHQKVAWIVNKDLCLFFMVTQRILTGHSLLRKLHLHSMTKIRHWYFYA
jgi:hypothetical protein